MFNITDEAVQCIKVITENNRCETCDLIGGERVRHQCGHCCCGDCVAKLEHCLLCLTPVGAGTQSPVPDGPAARRTTNAAKLLNTFQQAFKVDVYKRNRISEQLKTEKELFPDCIQAPLKYHNKRKSSLAQVNKENAWQSFFPGELISPVKVSKMENSLNYVQHWLDNNKRETPKKKPRKAFADLDVNSPNILKRRIPRRADLILNNVKTSSSSTRKKRKVSSFKSSLALVKRQSLLDNHLKPIINEKEFNVKENPKQSAKVLKQLDKTDKDESGIVMDDDPIIIDDSQSQVIDKDELAWRAVLEANEKSPYISQSSWDHNQILKSNNDVTFYTDVNHEFSNKVPFFKRSYLLETCHLCSKPKSDIIIKGSQAAGQPKDVSVTIESSSFLTTIKISTVQDKPVSKKLSIPIQTDITCNLGSSSNVLLSPMPQEQIDDKLPVTENIYPMNPRKVSSQDLFTAEMKGTEDLEFNLLKKHASVESAQVTIEDSDSDDAAVESSIIQVTADVHHSSEQLEPQILAELEPSEAKQWLKKRKRGHSPNSSNSSDKENLDPNRQKKIKHDKKKKVNRRKINDKIKKCC